MVNHVGGDMISLVLTLALPAAYACYQWWTAPGDNDDEKTSHSQSVAKNEQLKWNSGRRKSESGEERSGATQTLSRQQERVAVQHGGGGGVGYIDREQTGVGVLTQGVEHGQGRRGKRKKASAAEIQHLHNKIGRLLSTMNEYEDDEPALSGKSGSKQDDNECIICVTSPVSVHTLPCAHRVTCHKCLLRTMQTALTQRRLPLTCVLCRQKITGIQRIGRRQQQAMDDKLDISGSNNNSNTNTNHNINPNSKRNNPNSNLSNPNSNHSQGSRISTLSQNEIEISKRSKTARSGVVKWNQWASGERWSDDNDRWSDDNDRWSDDNDRWSDDNDRWSDDNDRWSDNSDRWSWWPHTFTTVDISPWWLI